MKSPNPFDVELDFEEELEEEELDILSSPGASTLTEIDTLLKKRKYIEEHKLERLNPEKARSELASIILETARCPNCIKRLQLDMYALKTGIVEPFFDTKTERIVHIYTDIHLESIDRSYKWT